MTDGDNYTKATLGPPPTVTPEELQAMPISPGRHMDGAVSSAAAPAVETDVAKWTDYPPTPEEVAPEGWRRRATTPPPPPASEESLDVRFRNLADQQASDIGKVRKDLGGEISTLRSGVDVKASREEVDSLSVTIGSLRGDIAAFWESVEGLKGTDDARREVLDALNKQVHGLVGTMETFGGRIKAVESGAEDARGELEALRQADTGFDRRLTAFTVRVRGIEQAVEELKGAIRGIRDEALPDVRKVAVRAEQGAAAVSAQIAELLPRLEYVEGLATKMRGLQNFMVRVAALERWRNRHSADIADIAVRVGLNELADELRGALPGEPKDGQ